MPKPSDAASIPHEEGEPETIREPMPASPEVAEAFPVPDWQPSTAAWMRDDEIPQLVRWIDSSLQNGQVDKFAFPEPTVIRSLGFLVRETDEYVVLARDDMGDGDYRGLVAIPRIAILKEGD